MPYITPHFRVEEFQCPCCGVADIDPALPQMLEKIRAHFGRPIRVSRGGGYRCPEYNRRIRWCNACGRNFNGLECPQCGDPGMQRSAKKSRHMKGTEADITIVGIDAGRVADFADSIDVRNVGRYWTFTHVGVGGSRNHRWDMRK